MLRVLLLLSLNAAEILSSSKYKNCTKVLDKNIKVKLEPIKIPKIFSDKKNLRKSLLAKSAL